jgi:hypothetical protein
MKINKVFKTVIMIIAIGIISLHYSNAQDSYLKDRLNFKSAFSRYCVGINSIDGNVYTGNYRIEGNYGFFNTLEAGAYLGFSKFSVFIMNVDTTFYEKDYFTPFYGVNLNFHILPLFIKKNDFRFDVYAFSKLGGLFINTPKSNTTHRHYNELALGGGVSFYPWNHLGVYCEYGFSKVMSDNKYFLNMNDRYDKLRFGLTLKF